jgi:hypothetical protein
VGTEHKSAARSAAMLRDLEADLRREHPDWSSRRLRRAAERALRERKRGIGGKGRG